MRKVSANLILPVGSSPLINGIITIDEGGMVTDLADTGGDLREEAGLEFYPGVIVPGFVIPCLGMKVVLEGFPGPNITTGQDLHILLKRLEKQLAGRGIRGIGLVLRESMASTEVLAWMSGSKLIYHPVIELCPLPGEDEFSVFKKGIDLISLAWNEFGLPCSLKVCTSSRDRSDLSRYLEEYASSHNNLTVPEEAGFPDILGKLNSAVSGKEFEAILNHHTLEAARAIFEAENLGSIATGKRPGLNLLKRIAPAILEELAGKSYPAGKRVHPGKGTVQPAGETTGEDMQPQGKGDVPKIRQTTQEISLRVLF